MTIRTVRPKKLFLALMVATISVLGVVQGAQSTTPGANGLIVYGQEVAPDHYQLFTIRPDEVGVGREQDRLPVGRPVVLDRDLPGVRGDLVETAAVRPHGEERL